MARKMEEMSSELSKIRLEKQKWNTPQEGNRNTINIGDLITLISCRATRIIMMIRKSIHPCRTIILRKIKKLKR